MYPIAFIDTEINPKSREITDIGGIKSDGSIFHKNSIREFIQFLNGTQFICGHNILFHDLQYIGRAIFETGINDSNIIDTLFLSPLLFPAKPYHSLVKDDKLQTEDSNNPLNDSIKAKELFYDELATFNRLDDPIKQIFYLLLNDKKEFQAFFKFVQYSCGETAVEKLIREKFHSDICGHSGLAKIIADHPVELAYCLALINCHSRYSITPPWVLKNFPKVGQVFHLLRNNPCLTGCAYCDQTLDVHKGLKKYFGFDAFRTFGGEPLQENAAKAAVNNKSLLAIFPTGGGKSITFQVPALMAGESVKGLTVVISPLQSLMKDQVDNLEKVGITDAVTINGLLDPIERAKSFERVENGSASLLYISPESLRSRTIERLILGRKIVRFVIDEAHCFSSWGQDFRVDYLYIGDFIKSIREKKNLETAIPVSCFTATAKQKVIEDIRAYFKEKLSLDLELYTSKTSRTNLHFKVFEKGEEEEKYQAVRELIEEKNCPSIIYVSRTRKAYQLAERLTEDGFMAKPYHGKMDVKEKTENQNAFIAGEVPVMVATSAFGMGVDKKDVGMVIHYEISDSLENYIQEAGRAGRDASITADCFVLFNEEDLNKHFILLNQTKLNIKEIKQIWKAIKNITRLRPTVSNSALEIARRAGWDENVNEIETRVKTAIAALEEAGYLKRGQNKPGIYANSILSKNAQEAIEKIRASERFDLQQKEKGIRIIKKLFSSKNTKRPTEEAAESRVDYISDHLGIVTGEVINIVNLLREEKILADAKDLTAFIKVGENKNRSLQIVEIFGRIENFLLSALMEEEATYYIKELNDKAELNGCESVSPNKIKAVLNFWAIRNWIKRQYLEYSKNHFAAICLHPKEKLEERLEKRHELARFIVRLLYQKREIVYTKDNTEKEEVLVEFSILELKEAYEKQTKLFEQKVSADDIEDALFFLSRIEAIKIEGGFMVVYNRLTIERLESDNKKQYKAEDYQKLNQFYENKVQQIHIVGEYAKRMLRDYNDALQFVEDYFQLNYASFLKKYFPGSKANELKLKITPSKFRQIFGELSPTQLKIINDNQSNYIVAAAGPGSGKTRVLVHKLASLLLMEDVKHEQLLMLTFSRAAVTEFKKRLQALIGNAAHFIEIKTFHSYCFDLLGKVGNLEKTGEVIKKTIDKIRNRDVELSRITKTVLVIDEAQDLDHDEFTLITTLMERNEDMRVIAVGDDDQNIYEFRGSDSKYLFHFIEEKKAIKYELLENYRSKNNLVEFTNQFVKTIRQRLKHLPVVAKQTDNGKIKIVRYKEKNLITPLVQDVLTSELTGTTCVLTKTNDEASQITGLLLNHGLPAKLIQTNDGFNLYNLAELRFFIDRLQIGDVVITDDTWEKAKRELFAEFQNSSKLELCKKIIKDFEATNIKKKYISDLEGFIRESKLEDFFHGQGETILVSTIHKAKGKEFDNVFLMLENFFPNTDEAKRLLYVAMTRAKQCLAIHLNRTYLDNFSAENLVFVKDNDTYLPPEQLVTLLSHEDVNLNYFKRIQHRLTSIMSGEPLTYEEDGLMGKNGVFVLKFSKKFTEKINTLKASQYCLKKAKVNFLLYWKDKDSENEIKILLPELTFERFPNTSSSEVPTFSEGF